MITYVLITLLHFMSISPLANSGILDEQVVGCYNHFPLSEQCISSIVPRCDLDRVARAVANYETGGCTTGVARYNNCHGLRYKGKWLQFDTKEDSYEYFKSLWQRRYSGGCPALRDAQKYDSEKNAETWLKNVNYFLN